MSTPANASGGPATLAAATGLKGLGAMGLFVTGFVATVSLIVQNVGTLPQAAIVTNAQPTVTSTSALKLAGQAQVLGAEPVGTSQVMVRMPAFTTPGAADRLGSTYGMELVGSYPAFGRYLFNLPQIRVEPADTSSRALIFFPPRTSAGEINAYLSANQLKVERWYRARALAGETPERTALVTLPRITPVMVDGVRGIWKAIIPMNIDATRLSAWATTSGIHVISYDPSTGALLIKGPAIAPKYVVTRTPVRRVTAPVVTQHVVTPPAPQPATQQLFVTFVLSTTSDVALAAIQQAGAQMVSFDATTGIAVVNVTSGNTTAVTTLLSAASAVKCVNTTATAACSAPAPPAVVVPTIAPTSVPVALRILPDTTSFSGTVLLSADVQSSDGTGQVTWTLSGALANITLGGATVAPIAGNALAWTSTVNFDSTTVPDGAYTLSIRIQDGLGNVTTANRSVTVSNAKPAQPSGFAAAPVPAGVALTWQQPAVADAALYRISRDGVQLAELPAGSTSYVDTTATAGAHTYQLVLVNRFGNASAPVATGLTVVPSVAVNSITLQVLMPGGDQLAVDGLAGGHLILSASELQASTSLVFQYTVDGASWSSVPAAVTCSTQCTADWNLAGIAPGHYRVRATGDQLVSNEAGFIVAAAAALPAPTALVATATTWGVDLHWTAPAGLIPPAYLVSRQTAAGWSALAQSGTRDYTDASAVAGQSYSYRVQAIGSDGTAGTPSDSASITLRAATASASPSATGPAAPTGLRVVDGPGGATLLWQPVPGVTRYVVERALDSAGTFQPLPAVAALMFRDTAQRVGGQVFYRVRSVGSNGVGDPSAVVAGLVLPGPAASTPAPFVVASATGQPAASTGAVELGSSQTAPVRAGNSVVVRAGGSDAGVDRADVQKLAGTSWLTLLTLTTTVTPGGWTAASPIDLSGVAAGDLQLRAVAKSAAGATLAVTAPAAVQVVHSAPMPTAVRASSSGTAVSLSWTAPASSASLTYSVYRAAGSGGFSLAASGLTTPTFDDHFLAGKVAVSYVVTATDDVGNQSAWSAPASLVTPAAWSQAPPTLQLILPASATLGDTVLLQATAGSARGIDSFTFAYSPQGSSVWINLSDRFPLAIGGPTLAGLTGLAAWGALFRTPGLAAGTYTVRATATDTLGHSTDAVRTLTVAASQSRGPPAPNFTINATASVGAVHLSWNAAGASYQVERSTDGAAGPFKAIGTTTSNSFDDRVLIPGFAYTYRVIGSGISSTVTATPLATPSSGTTSADQQVNVLLPAASAGGLNVSVAPASLTPSMLAGLHPFGAAYEINATSLGSGAQVHLLDQTATLTFTLPAGISAAQAAGLAVYHWDSALGVWRAEPSTVDFATGRITATVSHFSTFAISAPADNLPHAVITTPPMPVSVNTDLTLDALSSYHNDPARTIVSYDWDFAYFAPIGFHIQASGQVVTKIGGYPTAGTYPVALRVTDDNPISLGGPQSSIATVGIVVADPTADLAVTMTGPATALDGSNMTYEITITNAGPFDASGLGLFQSPFINTSFVSLFWSSGAPFTGSLAAGAAQIFTLVMKVNPGTPAGTVITSTVTVSASTPDPDPTNNFATVLTTVTDAPLTATGVNVATTEGATAFPIATAPPTFMGVVATFTDADPRAVSGNFTATINWGDAGTSTGTVNPNNQGGFSVAGSHTYLEEGTYTISVAIADVGGATATAFSTATVADALLLSSNAGNPLALTQGVSFTADLAAFAEANYNATSGDWSATINWGDLSPISTGTISQVGPQTFGVSGTHTYLGAGPFTYTVNFVDVGGTAGSVTGTANVAPAADVSIVTTGPATLTIIRDGRTPTNLSYSITVTNNGPSAAQGVTVTYTLPATTTLVSFAQNTGSTTGILLAGGTMTFTLTVTVPDATADGTLLSAAASVSSTTFDPDTTNNSSTATVLAVYRADIAVTNVSMRNSGTGPIVAGIDSFISRIVVFNNGPSAAANVVLTDTLPAGLTNVQLFPGNGISCQPVQAGQVTCTVAFLPTGSSLGVDVLGREDLPGDYTNTATVTTSTFDPNLTNNTAAAITHVVPQTADLAVMVESLPSTVVAGVNFTTRIVVTNNGPQTAINVNLVDSLPAGLTGLQIFTSGIGLICDSLQPTVQLVCGVAALSVGGHIQLDISAIEALLGTYTNTATVSSETVDLNLANNTASATTTVIDGALTATGVDLATTEGATTFPIATAPPTFMGIVATFADANPNGTASDFTATITWGDGPPTSAGTIALVSPGHFSVTGSHTFIEEGSYAISVAIIDVEGPTASATSIATVADAPILSANAADPLTLTPGVSFTADLAGFAEANHNATIGDWSATIDWGDHTTSSGTIFQVGPQTFGVSGTHTYLTAGTFTYTVTFTDVGGTTGHVTGTADVQMRADLAVTKTGPATANADTDVTYHLVMTNNGPVAAQNVHLRDMVPAGLSFVGVAGFDAGYPPTSYCFYVPTIDCTAASLGVGAAFGVTLTFHVTVATADGTVLTNTATASSDTFDPNTANNSASVSTTVVNRADLVVTKTGPATANAGTDVVYHLVMTNNGPVAAQNVHLRDLVPAGMSFVPQAGFDAGDPPTSYCFYVPTIDCTAVSLGVGAAFGVTLTFHISVAIADGTVLTDTATASSDTFDPNTANNSQSVGTTVVNRADLVVSKTGPASANVDTDVVYHLVVTNNGPVAAQNVHLQDIVPAGMSFVGQAGFDAGYPPTSFCLYVPTIDCSAVSLGVGAALGVTLTFHISPAVADGTVMTDTATASSATLDLNAANNSASVSTTMVAPADLSIVETGPATAQAGATITYTITATNNGPYAAQNVQVRASFPVGTTFVSFIQTSGLANYGPLPAGGTMTFVLTITVPLSTPDGTIFVSSATVDSTTFDPNHANNATSVSTTVVNMADLAIVKTGPATTFAGDTITYTITVTNNGPSAAQNVFMSEGAVPAHLAFVSGSFVQTSGPANGTTLLVGEAMTFTLRFTVDSNTAGGTVITNTATVRSTTADPNAGNNSSTANTTVMTRIVATGTDVSAVEGTAFGGQVATFTAGDVSAVASDFAATITWGDGTGSSTGTIVGGAGAFAVNGRHAYAEEGVYSISVVVTAGGQTAIAGSTAAVADAALTALGVSVSATEGALFVGAVATFTDANPNGTASEFATRINWGDSSISGGEVVADGTGGFTVTGTHTYAEEGHYSISVSIADIGGGSVIATSAATVADAALTAGGVNVAATEGAAFSGTVASFTDANPNGTASEFATSINWGDSSISGGTVVADGSGGFIVNGTHTYAEEGNYSVSVTITDAGGSSATTRSSAAVADAALQAQGFALPATRFTAFAGVVATFTDSDPAGVASDYVATINWGDGTTSIGNVRAAAGAFAVSASHVFGEGRFTITTTIVDAGGARGIATSTITVDLTAPVTTATVDGTLGHNGWWTAFEGPHVLTLTAIDNLTGVVVTYFTINGGVPQVYTGPISLDEGKYVITFWSIDAVGNVEAPHTIRIKVHEGHVEEDRDNGDGHKEAHS